MPSSFPYTCTHMALRFSDIYDIRGDTDLRQFDIGLEVATVSEKRKVSTQDRRANCHLSAGVASRDGCASVPMRRQHS